MKRIYLDQNKWIDLLRAHKGAKGGSRYEDALLLARAGVERGLLSFPLSDAHYMETGHRRDHRSRQELAGLMIELSRLHTMAPVSRILGPELDRAFQVLYGIRTNARPLQVFSRGYAHAFGVSPYIFTPPTGVRLSSERLAALRRQFDELVEVVALTGIPDERMVGVKGYDPDSHRQISERWAAGQEEYRSDKMMPDGWIRGDKLRRLSSANAICSHLKPINEALSRCSHEQAILPFSGEQELTDLIEHVPMIHIEMQLEQRRHQEAQKRWEPNDLADLSALTRAFAYCDVVVTEKKWAHFARAARLDVAYDTVILSDVGELPAQLV